MPLQTRPWPCMTVLRTCAVVAIGVLAATAGVGCSSKGDASSGAPRGPTERISLPTPAFDGGNGVIASVEYAPGGLATSLADLKAKADFVGVGTVVGEKLIEPTPLTPDEPAEQWSTLRKVRIDRVITTRPDGRPAPETLEFIGMGWNRNNDSGQVKAIVPSVGARVDVGDTFIAGFIFTPPPRDRQYLDSYEAEMSHWGYLGQSTVIVSDGRIRVDGRTAEFFKPFSGETVDSFAEKLRSIEPAHLG